MFVILPFVYGRVYRLLSIEICVLSVVLWLGLDPSMMLLQTKRACRRTILPPFRLGSLRNQTLNPSREKQGRVPLWWYHPQIAGFCVRGRLYVMRDSGRDLQRVAFASRPSSPGA